MYNNTTARDYVVVIRLWPDKARPAFEDHEVPVRAYDLMESSISAITQFEADHGFPSENGGRVKMITARAAGLTPIDMLTAMMKGHPS